MPEFLEPTTSKLRVKVTIGNAVKIITISGFAPDGNFNDAIAVLDAVLVEIGGSSYNVKSIKKISVWNVETAQWEEVVFIAADIAPIFTDYNPLGTIFTKEDVSAVFTDYVPLGNVFSLSDVLPVFDNDYSPSI